MHRHFKIHAWKKSDKIPYHLSYESIMKLDKKWMIGKKKRTCLKQLQRVNQLKNQVFRPKPSPVQMITQTEQTMTSESDSVTRSQQPSANDKLIIDSVLKTMQNRAKLPI